MSPTASTLCDVSTRKRFVPNQTRGHDCVKTTVYLFMVFPSWYYNFHLLQGEQTNITSDCAQCRHTSSKIRRLHLQPSHKPLPIYVIYPVYMSANTTHHTICITVHYEIYCTISWPTPAPSSGVWEQAKQHITTHETHPLYYDNILLSI